MNTQTTIRDRLTFSGWERGCTYLPPLLVLHPLSIHDAYCGERRKKGLTRQAKRKVGPQMGRALGRSVGSGVGQMGQLGEVWDQYSLGRGSGAIHI